MFRIETFYNLDLCLSGKNRNKVELLLIGHSQFTKLSRNISHLKHTS